MTRVPRWQEATVIKAVRRYGSDVDDLRDAAHEAAHGLQVNLPEGRWDRVQLDDALFAKARTFAHKKSIENTLEYAFKYLWRVEIQARAVEQIVCKRLGVLTDTVEVWANNAWLEGNLRSITGPSLAQLVKRIYAAMKTKVVNRLADRVIKLPQKGLDY